MNSNFRLCADNVNTTPTQTKNQMRQMKTSTLITIGLVSGSLAARAQFSSGSDGTAGPLNVTVDTVLSLPTNGIFNFTTITVASNATLRFNRNSNNTPVYLLATGDVNIMGTIDVSGSKAPSFPHLPGAGGPGGFDGGWPGFGTPPGSGSGPGGGNWGDQGGGSSFGIVGSGSYSSKTTSGNYPSPSATNLGAIYGSPLLVPIVGGSGGGGTTGSPGTGGGGGGGAILIASSTSITNAGAIFANGGEASYPAPTLHYNSGSGGAIRLVAPVVAGTGANNAVGPGGWGNDGRIRIDCIDRRYMNLSSTPAASVGNFMTVFPPSSNRLDIVYAAGTPIAEGSAPVSIQLTNGASQSQTVTLQARNFNTNNLPVMVVLTLQSGSSISYQTNIDNLANNPALVTVPVTIPVSTPLTINAWTRVP
jgi:hypothetical protein